MKLPHILERERSERFRKRCNRYWYRWMGLYTLALLSIVALIFTIHHQAHGALLSLLAGLFVAGIAITAWLAKQRARDEMERNSDASGE